MGAPICHIVPPSTVVNDRTQTHGPQMAEIPEATDLASALAAIRVMTDLIRRLSNQEPKRGGGTGGSTKQKEPSKPGRYVEKREARTVNEIVVHSKDDPEVQMTFKRIDGLTFVDSKTGEEWIWKR